MVVKALLLSILGILEIYTVDVKLAFRQAIYVLVGLILGYVAYRNWDILLSRQFFRFFYGAVIILLVVVLLVPSHTANRWISLGFINLQPSELVRILLPAMFFLYDPKQHTWKLVAISFPLFLLILVEPDLGASISVIFVMYMAFLVLSPSYPLVLLAFVPLLMILSFNTKFYALFFALFLLFVLISRMSWFSKVVFIIVALASTVIAPLVWNNVLKEYQRKRLIAFIHPEKYRKREAYQIYQARVAIGSGGLLGKGFNQGTQKKLGFLPEAHTDFIFASISEEFGFLGAFAIVVLASSIIVRILLSSRNASSDERRRALVVIALIFTYSFMVNVGTNLGLLPTKGYPLAFVSYGGSHIIVDYILLMLALRLMRS